MNRSALELIPPSPTARGERSSRSDHERFRGSEAEVLSAIESVDDPEYPGVSIVDLGLVEQVEVNSGRVQVGLVPTFSGCPALAMIASDVEAAVRSVDGVADVKVSWLTAPTWSPERLSQRGRDALAANFTVAVQIGDRTPECPLCGGPTVERSMFGPSRCRAVHRCDACSETVEVMRG